MPIEIVKVQRALASSHPAGYEQVLVYDKARKHMTEQPLTSDVREKMGSDMKAYFKGAWSSIVGWGLSERVKDQGW